MTYPRDLVDAAHAFALLQTSESLHRLRSLIAREDARAGAGAGVEACAFLGGVVGALLAPERGRKELPKKGRRRR